MSKLFLDLPTKIEFQKTTYTLVPWFDNILSMYDAIDGTLTEEETVDIMLSFLIQGEYAASTAMLDAILKLIFPPLPALKNTQRTMDFEQDAPYIYAAFLQAYQIDIFAEFGKLHWWKFLSLLQSLPSDTRFSEIVQIRTREIPPLTKQNQKEVQRLISMKQVYAISLSREEKEEQMQNALRKIAQSLVGGKKNG